MLRAVFRFLEDSKPFKIRLFTDLGRAAGHDVYFFKTEDISRILTLIDDWVASENGESKRIFGVRSNIGDGKTSLLGYVRQKYQNCVVVPLDGVDHDTIAPLKLRSKLVLSLLYAMKEKELLEEKVFNEAAAKFVDVSGYQDAETRLDRLTTDALRLYAPKLTNESVLFVCDNLRHLECLAAFKSLLEMRDPLPLYRQFFANVRSAVVCSTSERAIEEKWKESVRDDTSRLEWLRVTKENMFNIVKQVLEASLTIPPPGWSPNLKEALGTERRDNAVFPFDEEDLRLFLAEKAQKHEVGDPRHDVRLKLSEIQLRNTLDLMQRIIKEKAREATPGLVSLRDLIKEDTKDVP